MAVSILWMGLPRSVQPNRCIAHSTLAEFRASPGIVQLAMAGEAEAMFRGLHVCEIALRGGGGFPSCECQRLIAYLD